MYNTDDEHRDFFELLGFRDLRDVIIINGDAYVYRHKALKRLGHILVQH